MAVSSESTHSDGTMEEDEFRVCEFTERKISRPDDEWVGGIWTEVGAFVSSINRTPVTG